MPRSLALTAIIACLVGMAGAAALLLQKPVTSGGNVVTGTAAIGGPFRLVNQDGQTVTDTAYRGRFMLVYFGFTHCPDICPSSLQTITQALERMGPKADGIVPIFITVDPERDTRELMAQYVSSFHPRLVGLTGSQEDVAAAAKAYRVYARKVGDEGGSTDYTVDHSSFYYLMGPDGQFVTHFSHGVSAETLAERLLEAVGRT